MKILLATGYAGSWPYVPEMVEEYAKRGVRTDIFDIDDCQPVRTLERLAWRFPRLRARTGVSVLRRRLAALSTDYDAVNIQFAAPVYADLLRHLRARGRKLVTSIWGSDFIRASEVDRDALGCTMRASDAITTNNPEIQNKLREQYPEVAARVRIMPLGLRSLDVIARLLKSESQVQTRAGLGIDQDSVVVVCGYNATRQQQHLQIIQAIAALSPNTKARSLFVFPVTYPDDIAYKEEICAALDKTGAKYLLMQEKTSIEDICRVRIASDVTLNIQTTDSLSASIQEHIYAGSRIIVGKWLPYGLFEDMGVPLERVADASDIAALLETVVRKPDPAVSRPSYVNRIHDYSSWSVVADRWLALFN